MIGRVTFAATSKGAFRIEVAGIGPGDVTRFMLMGQGDEHELELELLGGPYTAYVTNIGTGERRNFNFEVEQPETILKIECYRSRRATWRSISGMGGRPNGWIARRAGEVSSNDDEAPHLPAIRMRTPTGWVDFPGAVMVNASLPTALKLMRPDSWSAPPLVRVEFDGAGGVPMQCPVPLFSGGTLVQWNNEDRQIQEITPWEPKSAAIVGSLANSTRDELPSILHWAAGSDEAKAIQSILHFRDDPWIAAATGLALAGAARLKESGSSLSRLAARNSWISDLTVLAAWGRAANAPDDAAGCLEMLSHARKGGTIFFWQTCFIADRLLSALASSSEPRTLRATARKEYGRWKKLSADAVKVGACLARPLVG